MQMNLIRDEIMHKFIENTHFSVLLIIKYITNANQSNN